jgi:hypothetical protein
MRRQTELENLADAVEIERFLNGDSNGASLFQRLFGAIADEPIPERLLAVIGSLAAVKPASMLETMPVCAHA